MFCRNTYYKIIFIFNFDAIYSDFGDIALRIVVNEVKKLLVLMGTGGIITMTSDTSHGTLGNPPTEIRNWQNERLLGNYIDVSTN